MFTRNIAIIITTNSLISENTIPITLPNNLIRRNPSIDRNRTFPKSTKKVVVYRLGLNKPGLLVSQVNKPQMNHYQVLRGLRYDIFLQLYTIQYDQT